MDYSLPIARRTRQRQAQIYKEYYEGKKKKKKAKNGVDSASASRPSGGTRKKLAKKANGVDGSDCVTTKTESESVTLSDSDGDSVEDKEKNGVDSASASRPSGGSSKKLAEKANGVNRSNCVTMKTATESFSLSDSSSDGDIVEEIDANLCGKEGDDLVGFVGEEGLGLKNKGKSELGFEGMDNGDQNVVVGDSDDEVVFLGEGSEKGEDFVCIDVDDEVVMSVKGVNVSSGLNCDVRKGSDNVVSLGEQKGESSCLKINVVSDDLDGFETLSESSSSEDNGDDEDEDYEVAKMETLSESTSSEGGDEDDAISDDSDGSERLLESSSSEKGQLSMDSGDEKGEGGKGGCKRGRPKGVGVGAVRRKQGLNFFVGSADENDNHINNEKDDSINASQDFNFVAQRTRSHFNSKLAKKKIKLGTLSHPLCVDEEEVDSSSGHDDDDSDEYDDGCMQKVYYSKGEGVLRQPTKRKFIRLPKKFDVDGDEEDDECMQKVYGKGEGVLKQATKRKCIRLPKKSDVINILLNSILDKGEVPMEELVSSRDESNVEISIPLKFTFGIEDSNLPEKTEEEKEMDKLWVEFDFALTSSEIGSSDYSEVENKDALPAEDESDRATLCHQGNHQLILDEEIGLVCAFCSYVKLEIKYILPAFSTNPWGKSGRGDTGVVNHSIFDELSFQDSGCDSHSGFDPHAHAKGTVWDIIPGIKSSMYPHQREGFEFIWKNIAGGIYLDKLKKQKTLGGGSGCIISHAPGTGKSRLAIVFLQTYMELYPTCRPIIVAPCNMLLTWEEEFRKWNFNIPFHNMNKNELSGKENMAAVSLRSQDGQLKQNVDSIRALKLYSWKADRSILGISYTLFEKLTGEVERKVKGKTEYAQYREILLDFPGLVVLDEGHTPRNSESLIFQAVSNIKTERRIILSGTPFQNNFDELYNVLCLARPKFADTETRGKWASLTSSITRVDDDKLKRVRDMINPFVHVYKGTILQEKLPGLKDSVVILKPSRMQKSLIQGIQALRCHFTFDFYESLISVHPSLLPKLEKEEFSFDRGSLERVRLNPESGVKINFLMEFIPLCEAMNEKVLVFGQFIEPLTLLADHLKSHFNWTEGKEVLYMDGKLDVKQRQCSINVFNDPTSEVRVLLASTRACNEGINLVGASRVVLLDVVWNPSVERQAISRAYRLGQEKVVYIYHLIASGTKEEEKYVRQVEKDLLSEKVFSSSGRSGNQQKISPMVLEDKILEEMVQHKNLGDMFENILYQQKESFNLIETFN